MRTTRVDRKYLVPEDVVQDLLQTNPDLLAIDAPNGLDVQRYRTQYWDTPDLTLFHDGRGKRAYRRKVRIRRYGDGGAQFIEVKSRDARGMNVKTREAWTGHFVHAQPFLRSALADQHELVNQLVPTAFTAYERSAYMLPSGARITVDRRLVVGSSDAGTHGLFDDGQRQLCIVETKSPTGSPTVVDRQLWHLHGRPISLSKYALAVLSFRPDLPPNRWALAARGLRRLDVPISTD